MQITNRRLISGFNVPKYAINSLNAIDIDEPDVTYKASYMVEGDDRQTPMFSPEIDYLREIILHDSNYANDPEYLSNLIALYNKLFPSGVQSWAKDILKVPTTAVQREFITDVISMFRDSSNIENINLNIYIDVIGKGDVLVIRDIDTIITELHPQKEIIYILNNKHGLETLIGILHTVFGKH